ncbi:putative DNA binding protein [uncultured Mediterranean phage uvMED]|nr:putative DNA binding protein [uncultured Mediterranean phage uvMED]BAR17829.1 putative DNA binding protein [uncultured Mediterranean phage uvMED]
MSNLEKEDRREYTPRLHNPKTDRVIIYNDRESEISYLSSKRILTYMEVQAADIYRRLWETIELKSRGDSTSLEAYGCRIQQSKGKDSGDIRLVALDKMNYINSVIGENNADALQHICGMGYTIKQYSRKIGVSSRKASSRLKQALNEAFYPLGLRDNPATIRNGKKT